MNRIRIFLKLSAESIAFALHALRANMLRTVLSLLGISIGIFAIISVFTVVDAMEKNVRTSVESLGDKTIYVQKWPWAFGGDYPWWKYWQRPLPSVKEMHQLAARSQSIEAFTFEAYLNGKTVKYLNNSAENVTVALVSHDFDKVKSFELSAGRYLTEMESNSGRAVGIIGSNVANGLFGSASNALGKVFEVMGRKVEVIGVFKEEGKSLLETEMDNTVVLPLNFGRNFVNIRSDRIDPFIKAKVKEGVPIQFANDELKSIMRSIRRLRPIEDDNFALNQSSLLSNNITNIFSALNMAGAIIGGFSILVGGFGIEISLGANNYFILMQFLFEAIVLCLIGGLIGLSIIYFLAMFVSHAFDYPLSLTGHNIMLGLFISALIGLVSGFIPAYSASQLDPVEAIRANG